MAQESVSVDKNPEIPDFKTIKDGDKVTPYEKVSVYATAALKGTHAFGEKMVVHPMAASKLIERGKATAKAPSKAEIEAAEAEGINTAKTAKTAKGKKADPAAGDGAGTDPDPLA